MNPQDDDPEVRIRALEQSLEDVARSSELGTEHQYGNGYGFPPPTQQWHDTDPYLPGYPQQPSSDSGLRTVMVLVPVVVVLLAVAGAVTAYLMFRDSVPAESPGIAGGGGYVVDEPSTRSRPTVPAAPSVDVPEPGTTVSISGLGARKTLACNDNAVSVSGKGNKVDITGHCTGLIVSGFENIVTVESADEIIASGFDNRVTFLSGSPQISESGFDNTVEQG